MNQKTKTGGIVAIIVVIAAVVFRGRFWRIVAPKAVGQNQRRMPRQICNYQLLAARGCNDDVYHLKDFRHTIHG